MAGLARGLLYALVDGLGLAVVRPLARLLRAHRLAEEWTRLQVLATGNRGALSDLADYYAAVGLEQDAEEAHRAAIAADPSDGSPHLMFAAYLETRSRAAQALEHYEAALRLGSSIGADYEAEVRDHVRELRRRLDSAG